VPRRGPPGPTCGVVPGDRRHPLGPNRKWLPGHGWGKSDCHPLGPAAVQSACRSPPSSGGSPASPLLGGCRRCTLPVEGTTRAGGPWWSTTEKVLRGVLAADPRTSCASSTNLQRLPQQAVHVKHPHTSVCIAATIGPFERGSIRRPLTPRKCRARSVGGGTSAQRARRRAWYTLPRHRLETWMTTPMPSGSNRESAGEW
jgi:hypothetical protein